jgi:hypothetical protein
LPHGRLDPENAEGGMTRTGSDERLTQARSQPSWFGADWGRYLGPPLAKPRDLFALAAAIAVSIAFDLAVRSGVVGVAGAVAIALASTLLAATGRVRNRQAMVLLAVAPVFGIWLVLRASDWLSPLNVLASCALVLLASSLASGGTLWDLSLPKVAARAAQSLVQVFLAPAFLLSGWSRDRSRAFGLVRGLLVAIPVLLIFGVLLASADAVFASFVDFDISDIVEHTVALAFALVAMAGLLRLASVEHVDVPDVRGPKLGPQEWTVVLVLLNVMLGTFAAARLVALSEGGRRVIESAGLTYAEYARSGFFQLLAASLLAVGVIAALRATADIRTTSERLRFTILSLGVVLLTLALVVSAFHRLFLYEQEFGLTMLRLYAQSAIVWVGAVLIFLALSIAGVGGRRVWVWSAAGVTALLMLFAMNVLNPEAFVVRHNVEHQRSTQFDPSYLDELGSDAAPELAKHRELSAYVCGYHRDGLTGWAAYNRSVAVAEDIGDRTCGPHQSGAKGG